ncbi:cyclin-dependent kinase 2-interacting protein [Myripristis murdjan]|uniref:cyclin-dependent kinase 2-interacting protein n=1 Tax=Myripristis murdjan TaxID=586833 RepID=UPI001175FC20|nr:cyclin-dependent kinase 2-interacting protein [Myripristis murdjan]
MEGNRKCSAVTGSARKVRDNAADWHNLMLRWDKLNDAGFAAAGRVVDLRLRQSHGEAPPPALSSAHADLQQECQELLDVLDKMAAVVMKMRRLAAWQSGLVDLERFQLGDEGRPVPLFHGWRTAQFEEASRQLLEAYGRELKLKRAVLQELAHTATSDLCMVYLSCWLHQPYTPPQARLRLEALLLETGHRPL